MMGGRIRSAWVAFGVAACGHSALLPPRAEAQAAFSVELRVEGHQDVLAAARSDFSKALEAIPDVAVVDSSADWELLVLAADMRSGETDVGIVVGATVLEVVDGDDLAAVEPDISAELRRYLLDRPLGLYKNMWVYYGGPEDMAAIARRVVADVNASVFAPCRRTGEGALLSVGRPSRAQERDERGASLASRR